MTFSFSIFAKDLGTLEVRRGNNDVRKYAITEIKVVSNAVLVKGSRTIDMGMFKKDVEERDYCILVADWYANLPRSVPAGCENCATTPEEHRIEFLDMFKNAKSPHVSCDIADGRVSGFSFIGLTTIRGKSALYNKGVIFDMSEYRDGQFKSTPKELGPIDSLLDQTQDILLKTFFELHK